MTGKVEATTDIPNRNKCCTSNQYCLINKVTFAETVQERTISSHGSKSCSSMELQRSLEQELANMSLQSTLDLSHEDIPNLDEESSAMSENGLLSHPVTPVKSNDDLFSPNAKKSAIDSPAKEFRLITPLQENELDVLPEFGGSHVVDDFHQLNQEVTGNILEDFDSPTNLSFLNDSTDHNRPSSVLSDKSIHGDKSILIAEEAFSTPHTDRILPSGTNKHDLMSPGSFFATKSGHLGALGGKLDSQDRPSWYTPKRDHLGKIVDPIGPTPCDRSEKTSTAMTPAGARRVRSPLYESPSKQLEKPNLPTAVEASTVLSNTKRLLDDWMANMESQKAISIDDLQPTQQKRPTNLSSNNHIQVVFKPINYKSSVRVLMSLYNESHKPQAWRIDANGPVYMETTASSTRHRIQDECFKFSEYAGHMEPQQNMAIHVYFRPLLCGKYLQTFHLRCGNRVFVIKVEGVAEGAVSSAKTVSEALPQWKDPRDVLDFGSIQLGHVKTLSLRVCNSSDRPVNVDFIATGPFSLPTQRIVVQAQSYVPIPVAFHPVRAGKFNERLIIRKEQHTIRVELLGKSIDNIKKK